MGQVFARCIDCSRLFGVTYQGTPPARDELTCTCGSERFREIRIEQRRGADSGPIPELVGDRILSR